HADFRFVRGSLEAFVRNLDNPQLALIGDQAFKLNIEPDRIATHWNVLINDTVSSHHPILKYPPESIAIGNYVPANSVAAVVTNQNDALFYQRQARLGNTEADPMVMINQMLGISVEND